MHPLVPLLPRTTRKQTRMTQQKTRVALLFGGRTSEHIVGTGTASGVLGAIDTDKYEVIPVGITLDGVLTLQDGDPELWRMRPDRHAVVQDNGTRVHFPEAPGSRELFVTEQDGTRRSLGEIDVVFPALLGPTVEDGAIQGWFELLDIPYVGNGILASAIGFDKDAFKRVLEQAGVPIAPWYTVTAREWAGDRSKAEAAAEGFGYPVFVKPARAGSSVGVSKVKAPADLAAAVEVALAEDSKVLIEPMVVGREVEVSVLGGRDGAAPRVSVAGEIIVTGREFYDFEAKYSGADGVELRCPTEMDPADLAEMQRLAALAFEAIGGAGLARADFFLTEQGFVVNELNTLPGFTPISMYPKLWEASGLAYGDLIDELIQLGLETVR